MAVTFPATWDGPQFKTDLVPKKKAKAKRRGQSVSKERQAKREAKVRDGGKCRFPLCGCTALGLKVESSHLEHKGMGGNPAGDRSTTAGLMTACGIRHRTGRYAIDKKNIRYIPLTDKGCDGPVRWEIKFKPTDMFWTFLADEESPGVLRRIAGPAMLVLTGLALDVRNGK